MGGFFSSSFVLLSNLVVRPANCCITSIFNPEESSWKDRDCPSRISKEDLSRSFDMGLPSSRQAFCCVKVNVQSWQRKDRFGWIAHASSMGFSVTQKVKVHTWENMLSPTYFRESHLFLFWCNASKYEKKKRACKCPEIVPISNDDNMFPFIMQTTLSLFSLVFVV